MAPRARRGAEALRAALRELEIGRCVLIFPEGTRTTDGGLGRFREGFMLLVKRTGAPVVPVGIDGSFDTWPKRRRLPTPFRRIEAVVGDAIDAAQLVERGDDAVEDIKRAIEELRLDARARLRRRSGGKFPPAGPHDVPYWEREAGDDADQEIR